MPSEKTPFQASESVAPKKRLSSRLLSWAEKFTKTVLDVRGRIFSVETIDESDFERSPNSKPQFIDPFTKKFEDEFQRHISTMKDGFDTYFYQSCVRALADQLAGENPEQVDRIVFLRDHYLTRSALF